MQEITNHARYWFNMAKEVAKNSDHDDFKHGAVLVKGGSVIEKSANYKRYLSFADRFRDFGEWYGTYHAEVGCVLQALKRKSERFHAFCCSD